MTIMGTGEVTSTMAAVAVAVTVVEVDPNNRMSVAFTLLETVTFTRWVGYTVDKVTPGADVGKSTVTVSADVLNPSRPAYLHGVRASPVAQVNEEPVENFAELVLTVLVPS